MNEDDNTNTYPADALRVSYARGVQSLFTIEDIERVYKAGVQDAVADRNDFAPDWMLSRLWRESAAKKEAERRLQPK